MRSVYLAARLTTAVAVFAIIPKGIASPVNSFFETVLASDGVVPSPNPPDPQLKNAWGISFGPTTPFWVSDNGTGVTTLYNGAGAKQGLVVTIPGPSGAQSSPTGQVFNGITAGKFNGGSAADLFIFATEDGTIAGWRGALGTTAETLFDNSANGAIYKGLAIGNVGSNTYLYATDFGNSKVTAFASNGAPALPGSFTDPGLSSGYAPFGIENIGGDLFVTYALKDGKDDLAGPGHGFVDEFDLNGNFIKRIATMGNLNSPWGLALAPAGFGPFGGDLLVGNFGNGLINAFNLTTDTFVATLDGTNGNPLPNDGLWALKFGNNGPGFDPNALYLTAGPNGESNGIFARIDPVPEPGTFALLTAGLLLGAAIRRRRSLL